MLTFTLVILKILQQIINVTWHSESHGVERLSRWIRCLFTLAMTSDVETAERLLDQVMNIVKEASKVRKGNELAD